MKKIKILFSFLIIILTPVVAFSQIQLAAAGGETENIDYANFQSLEGLTTANSVSLFSFTASVPADSSETSFSWVNLRLTFTTGIRRIGVFEDNTRVEQMFPGSVKEFALTFPSRKTLSPGDSVTYTIRATLNTNFEDNQVIIVSAGLSSAPLIFVTGDTNKIVVTADRLSFLQGPTDTYLNDLFSPPIEVLAIDASSKLDLDYNGQINLSVPGGSGTLTGGSAMAVNGIATFDNAFSSKPDTGSVLEASASGLMSVSAPLNILDPPEKTDIIADGTYTPTTNIDYINYITSDIENNSSKAISVAKFVIREGGMGGDRDSQPTMLDSIGFSVDNYQNIDRIALYTGGGDYIQEVAANSEITFGVSRPIPDDLTATFEVRVSFKNKVTEKRVQLTVNKVIDAPGGSLFVSDPTGATSSTSGNKIEVTATKFSFARQPPSEVYQYSKIDSFIIIAFQDANNNFDLDPNLAPVLFYLGSDRSLISDITHILPLGTDTAVVFSNFMFSKEQINDSIRVLNPGFAVSEIFSDSFNVLPPSAQGDIIVNAGFTYPENIDHKNNIATAINTSSDGLEIAQFIIRDGGSGDDPDDLPTLLTTVNLNVDNWENLERIALYDGATELDEKSPSSMVIFTGFTHEVDDDSQSTLSILATFKTSDVTDNDSIKVAVSSLDQSMRGSRFVTSAADAPITGNQNRIQITYDTIVFMEQLRDTFILDPVAPMILEATDIYGNRCLDLSEGVFIEIELNTSMDVPVFSRSAIFSNGLITFNLNLNHHQYSAAVDGEYYILTRTSLGLNPPRGRSNNFKFTVSEASDIIATLGYSYSENILYANYQGTDVNMSNSAPVFGVTVRDGGELDDADRARTKLDYMRIAIERHDLLQKVALYDGVTELAEVEAKDTIEFTQSDFISPGYVSVGDDMSKNLELRVTFKNNVEDNAQFQFSVLEARRLEATDFRLLMDTASSIFAPFPVDGVTSSILGDQNKIEVVGIAYEFTQEPSKSIVRPNVNLIPSPLVVQAIDGLGIVDKDYADTANITNSGGLSMTQDSLIFSMGVGTFSSDFQFTTHTDFRDNGTLTVTDRSEPSFSVTGKPLTVDGIAPTLTVTGTSPSSFQDGFVKQGDMFTMYMEFSEEIDEAIPPKISIGSVTNADLTKELIGWSYQWNVVSGGDMLATAVVTAFDSAGNAVGMHLGHISYNIDNTPPVIESITRSSRASAYTNSDEVYFQINFSEDVIIDRPTEINVMVKTTGTVSLSDMQLSSTGEITVSGVSGDGEMYIELKILDSLIYDLSRNDITAGMASIDYTRAGGGVIESYMIDNTPPQLISVSPESGSFNVPKDGVFSINFNELMSIGTGTASLTVLTGTASGDGNSAPANLVERISDESFSLKLTIPISADTAKHYFRIPSGFFTDSAGNAYAGFNDVDTWSFITSGPARIDNSFDIGECVSDTVTLTGQYFTGTSEIWIGDPSTIGDMTANAPRKARIVSVDEDQMEFIMPDSALSNRIYIRKLDGQNGNTESFISNSQDSISVGPTSATFTLTTGNSIGYVCNDPARGAPNARNANIDVFGGVTDIFNVKYEDRLGALTTEDSINDYALGTSIEFNPSGEGVSQYYLTSVIGEVKGGKNCSVLMRNLPSSFSFQIEEFTRSVVTTNSILGYCPTGGGAIDLNIGDVGASIRGSVTSGFWSIENAPPVGGGGFNVDGTEKTATFMGTHPTYYPTFTDALGALVLKFESDAPTGNNPCRAASSLLNVQFLSDPSLEVPPIFYACPKDEFTALIPDEGGSANTVKWSRDDKGLPGFDIFVLGSNWGFTQDMLTFSDTALVGVGDSIFYKMGPNERVNLLADLLAVPLSSTCTGVGDTANVSIEILPEPRTELVKKENVVCVGDKNVTYEVEQRKLRSTYEWILPSEHTIEGDELSYQVNVSFGKFIGEQSIKVVETGANGCVADTFSIDIEVDGFGFDNKDTLEIIEPVGKTIGRQNDIVVLKGKPGEQDPASLRDFSFSGSGVLRTADPLTGIKKWIFSPIGAGVGEHSITYSVTNRSGCTFSVVDTFNVFDLLSSIVYLDSIEPGSTAQVPIKESYCEDEPAIKIELIDRNRRIIDTLGEERFYRYYAGAAQVAIENNSLIDGAIFYPSRVPEGVEQFELLAYRETNISRSPGTERDTSLIGTQTIIINRKPEPSIVSAPSSRVCTHWGDQLLERNIDRNSTTNFKFSLRNIAGDLPDDISDYANTVSVDSSDKDLVIYKFHPDNVNFENIRDSLTGKPINIYYTYTDVNGCDTFQILNTRVFPQPFKPELTSEVYCVEDKNAIPIAEIVNFIRDSVGDDPAPARAVDWLWYTGDKGSESFFRLPNANRQLDFVAPSASQLSEPYNIFALYHSINGCSSDTTQFYYEILDSLDVSLNTNIIGGDKPVTFTFETNQGVPLDTLLWVIDALGKTSTYIMTSKSFLLGYIPRSSDFMPSTITQAALHNVSVKLKSENGCKLELNRRYVFLQSLGATASASYNEDFNTNPGDWVAFSENNVNSWLHGEPLNKDTISTDVGDKVWVTSDGPLIESELSYLYSPVFDLSGMTRPMIVFDRWVDFSGFDGVAIQYSTDSLNIENPNKAWINLGSYDPSLRSGTGKNWYNSQDLSFGNSHGWSGESNQWLNTRHKLDKITDNEGVIFRFVFSFSARSVGVSHDGVALDNVRVLERNKLLMLESFVNLAEGADQVEDQRNYLDDFFHPSKLSEVERGELVEANYHIGLPLGDPLHPDYKFGPSARTALYGITLAPTNLLNGLDGMELGSLENWFQVSFNSRVLEEAKLGMTIQDVSRTSDNTVYRATVELTGFEDVNAPCLLFVSIIEKGPIQGTNAKYVVKSLLPSISGTSVPQIVKGEVNRIEVRGDRVTNITNHDQVRVLAFLQEAESREVLQAAYLDADRFTGIDNITSAGTGSGTKFNVYPNPATDELIIDNLPENTSIKLINNLGKVVISIQANQRIVKLNVGILPRGLYHIQIRNELEVLVSKSVILADE